MATYYRTFTEEILDSGLWNWCAIMTEHLSRRPAIPLTAKGNIAQHGERPVCWQAIQSHRMATVNGAGFLRLIPPANNGKNSVHFT